MIKMLKPKLKGLNFKKPLKMRIIVLFRGQKKETKGKNGATSYKPITF